MHHKPCVVREEDRKRYGVAKPGELIEVPSGCDPAEYEEDLNRIAKWQPGELKRMSDAIIAKVLEPILASEKEKLQIEKALEFSRGYAEGQAAERERCLFHAEDTILAGCLYQSPSNPHAKAIAKLIKSGR